MTLSLATDILHYVPEQLNSLAQHIQTTGGELTSPIMQVYEEDIRTPIKSAIRGTLIRGMLVQVQKAKVCFRRYFYYFYFLFLFAIRLLRSKVYDFIKPSNASFSLT
jgi:ATP synthase regulation protein NCA2